MRYARFVTIGLTLAVAVSTHADQSPSSTQVVRGGIDLVQVDVSVLDKNRRPIRDLSAADFTLLEDGKSRPVAAFTRVDLPARAPAPRAAWMREVRSDVATNVFSDEGRLVVILMDRTIPFGLPTQSARRVAKAAIEQLGPGDLAAVVYTGSAASQNFTNDRARLTTAIGENPTAVLSREAVERWELQKDQLEAEIWNPDTTIPPRILPADYSGECACGLCTLHAIRNVADAVRDTQGRKKSLLFIGADIVFESTDPRCESSVIDAREAMFKSIDRASLTVHAFDANGLETNAVAASAPASQSSTAAPISPRENVPSPSVIRSRQLLQRQGNLAVLPDRTGGRTVLNTNYPEGRVPDVFRESESYYLLGFEPAAMDGRDHTISVHVNRRDVNVRSRRAHVADRHTTSPSASAADRARSAIAGPIATRSGITLTANALTVADPVAHTPTLIVALHARHEASQQPPASEPELVNIVTAVFRRDGRPVGTFHQTVSVVPRADARGAAMTYDVLQRMVPKPGHYELRIAVDNPLRRQSGSVYTFVDVPALGNTPFTWSEIGISAAAITPGMKDPMTDVLPALPIARRDFDRQERVTAFISAYHTSGPLPSGIEVSTRITDEQNRQKFERKSSLTAADFDTSRTAAYQIDLPLASLEPGSYLLTMEAGQARSKTPRHVRFTVR